MTTLMRQGKVRDVYDLGDQLLMVATDRISAFDWILPTTIPDKGRVLTQISLFWFDFLGIENHLISTEINESIVPEGLTAEYLEGRSMLVRKCDVVPFECVVRGYLVGSGWKDYQQTGQVCGIDLAPNLQNCAKLTEPIFTPATKAEEGHDENVSFEFMASNLGEDNSNWLRDNSIQIYQKAADYAASKGIILADTKFEFGWYDNKMILIDEVLTPDSSRFWPADDYEQGRNQVSYDKQFVREFLETTDWDKNSQPPELPEEIVEATRQKYVDAFERLTEKPFPWK